MSLENKEMFVATGTEVEHTSLIEVPPYIFVSEGFFLLTALLLAVILLIRSGSRLHFLLIAALGCLLLERMPFVLVEFQWFQSWHAGMRLILATEAWYGRFQSLGALLLMLYLAAQLKAGWRAPVK